MNTRVICTKCKAENALGSMFCRKCGEKLDVSESSIRSSKHSGRKQGGGFVRFLRMIILLALLACLGLMLWQVEPLGTPGDPEHALVFQDRLLNLERAWQQGVRLEEEVSEPQVNAYLAQALDRTNRESQEGALFVLRTINLAFIDGAFILTTISDLGLLRVSYEVQGSVMPGGGELVFDVEKVRLGHLVVPGFLADQAAARVAHVFSNMQREREILSHAAEISLGIDRIRIKL